VAVGGGVRVGSDASWEPRRAQVFSRLRERCLGDPVVLAGCPLRWVVLYFGLGGLLGEFSVYPGKFASAGAP